MKVYLIEWGGCERGGLEEVAFDSQEKAEKWVEDNTDPVKGHASWRTPKSWGVDDYEIFEVEIE